MNSSLFFFSSRERERENENENEHTAIFRIGRKTTFQQRNAIKSLPLTLKTPIIIVLQQKNRGVFISANKSDATKQQKTLCFAFKRKGRTSEEDNKREQKNEEREEPLV